MSRTRGHVIVKTGDKFTKLYLAYNGNPEWMIPILDKDPSGIANKIHGCRTGICQIEEHNSRVHVVRYHDYNKLDHEAHENQEFVSLEEALDSCVLEDIYVWDGESWSHKTIDNVVATKRLIEIRPLKRKRNVWREIRESHGAEKSQPE